MDNLPSELRPLIYELSLCFAMAAVCGAGVLLVFFFSP